MRMPTPDCQVRYNLANSLEQWETTCQLSDPDVQKTPVGHVQLAVEMWVPTRQAPHPPNKVILPYPLACTDIFTSIEV